MTQSWPTIEPSTELLNNWHIDATCDYLEAVHRGDIKRLIINMPPRMMKSILVSVCFPCWEWTKKPGLRYIFVSYSKELSSKHSVDRRIIMESSWYRSRWGDDVKFSDDTNMKAYYANTAQGKMFSTSVGGQVTGFGGNRIVMDDLHDPEEAESPTARETAIRYFKTKLYNRLDNKRKDAIVCVMQRVHEGDIAGYLIDEFKEQGFEVLRLPAECEEEDEKVISTPSGITYERQTGDLLWPEREGPDEIAALKEAMGPYAYAAQYQQRPAPSGGGMLPKDRWRYWTRDTLPALFDRLIQSWDMTFKDTTGSDYVAGMVLASKGPNIYILDLRNERMAFPKTLMAVKAMRTKWPTTGAIYVEDKANGPAIISSLSSQIPGLIAVNPEGGKEARVSAISYLVDAGNVYLPDPSYFKWVNEFILQAARFPKGKNDDMVDAFSQGCLKLRLRSRPRMFLRCG